jgi:hypothetical protein
MQEPPARRFKRSLHLCRTSDQRTPEPKLYEKSQIFSPFESEARKNIVAKNGELRIWDMVNLPHRCVCGNRHGESIVIWRLPS